MAVAIPVAADVQPVPIKITNVDPVALGAHVLAPNVEALKQPLTRGQEQRDGGEHHVACPRILLALRDQSELLLVSLEGGLIDGLLAQEEPAHTDRRVRERLALVPSVAERAIKQLRGIALHVAGLPDVVDGHREARDENMGVSAGVEYFLGEGDLHELRTVARRVGHAEGLLHLLDAEEVATHNGPRLVIRLGHGEHPFLQGFVIHAREPLGRGLLQPRLVAECQQVLQFVFCDAERRKLHTEILERFIGKHLIPLFALVPAPLEPQACHLTMRRPVNSLILARLPLSSWVNS